MGLGNVYPLRVSFFATDFWDRCGKGMKKGQTDRHREAGIGWAMLVLIEEST